MHFKIRNLVIFLVVGQLAFSTESVSPEERKAEFAKPRGLSSPNKNQSSSPNSGSVAQPSPAATSVNEVYKKMGEGFDKEMTKLSKDFSLPKASEEPNYLDELEKARKSLDSAKDQTGNSKASLLAQYTDALIATLNQLAQMQIERDLSQISRTVKTRVPTNSSVNQDHLNPSPISLRTPISSGANNGRGLFPAELDSLNAKAYNPPK